MPQMAPMPWILLFFTFSSGVFISMIKIYYI